MRRLGIIAACLVVCSTLACGQEAKGPVETQGSGASATAAPSNDPREIVRQAALNDMINDQKAREYTFMENQVLHKLDGKGKRRSTESKTYEFMMLYGEPVRRLVARDGKPLSGKEAAKEEEQIDKLVRKREQETPEQRQKRLAQYEKDREQERAFVGEIADAYYFHLLGEEAINGRPAWVIGGEPRPDFHAHMKEARILPKFRFKVWVDKTERQWVKLDANVIDTVSFGWFLARLYPGSRLLIDETRVNDEVWLPRHVELRLDARLALLKKYNLEEAIDYSDYRKFRTDTRIVGGAVVK